MGKPRLDPLEEVDFRCQVCALAFTAAPETTEAEEDPEQDYHPWFYTATCPRCRGQAEQDPRERGLLKAWAHATGPRTEEGKARSAANLEGHPTPEEAKITRMNSMKTGAHARVLKMFPAKPGRYAQCESCDYRGDICIDDPPPGHKNPVGCMRKAEVFLAHQVAFESGDPSMLTSMRANTQASLQVIIDEMILQIAQDGGPRIKELQWFYDKEGTFQLARYRDDYTDEWVQIYELKAHPLLKPLIDFISKNSLTLDDMGMTPKVQQENDLLQGHLEGQARSQESMLEWQRQQDEKNELLKRYIANAAASRKKDPVLIEHQQADADG